MTPPRALLLLALSLLLGCSPGRRISVIVSAYPEGVRRLQVELRFPRSDKTEEISEQRSLADVPGLFVVVPPERASFPVTITVYGLSGPGCLLAEGRGVAIDADGGAVTVTLSPVAQPGCNVLVGKVAEGRGTVREITDSPGCRSAPEPFSCGDGERTCPALPLARPDQTICLEAVPAAGSFFLGWSGGGCRGTGRCVPSQSPVGVTSVHAAFAPQRVCRNGWCWDNPLPQGVGIYRVFGFSENDLWAVGAGGVVLRSPGDFFAPMPRVTDTILYGLWGPRSDEMFAVGGGGTILRWDGDAFHMPQDPPPTQEDLTAVWGDGAGRVFAVGGRGAMLESTGGDFQALPPQTERNLNAVYASGDTAFAAGDGGVILQRKDGAWRPVESGTTNNLCGLWGHGAEVFAVGEERTLLRWSGAGWQRCAGQEAAGDHQQCAPWGSSPPPRLLYGVWGFPAAGGTELFATGSEGTFYAKGCADWETLGGLGAVSVWGASSRSVWTSNLRQWNGRFFSGAPSVADETLTRVLWSGPDDLWAVGTAGAILRYRGGVWERQGSFSSANNYGLWQNGPGGELWVVGQRGLVIHRRADGNYERVAFEPPPEEPSLFLDDLLSVQGFPDGKIWFGGAGLIFQLDTATGKVAALRKVTSPIPGEKISIRGIWGTSSDDVWFVGHHRSFFGPASPGVRIHWVGGTVATSELVGDAVFSVFGRGGSLWTAGSGGQIWRRSGEAWVSEHAASGIILDGLWGSERGDLWAVGTGGLTLRREGQRWTPVSTGNGGHQWSIHGAPTGEAWSVGLGGSILHYLPEK